MTEPLLRENPYQTDIPPLTLISMLKDKVPLVKVFAVKAAVLSLVSDTHIVEEEN